MAFRSGTVYLLYAIRQDVTNELIAAFSTRKAATDYARRYLYPREACTIDVMFDPEEFKVGERNVPA